MDKIYSRPRIQLLEKRKLKKIFFIAFVFLVIIIVVKTMLNAVYPIFSNLCQEKAKAISTTIVNEQTKKVMENYSYDSIFEIDKDNSGNISMIKSNIFTINKITSEISLKIQKEINKLDKDRIGIAIGSFTGSKLLSGVGPNINIRISTIGNIETDLKSEFVEQGINQTLHTVYLQMNCKIIVLTPFHDIETEISNKVLIAENVIVGNIPESYYDFEGMNQEDLLNVIQ